jgi:hypothetical protein
MVLRQGVCCGAAIALTVLGCSSSGPTSSGDPTGSTSPVRPASLTQSPTQHNVTPLERAGSPLLPEDSAPEYAAACDSFVGLQAGHISALLGRSLVGQRGSRPDLHDTCSLLGDGIRVRFVTTLTAATETATRLKCHTLAGADAQFIPGVASVSWQGQDGVYTAQSGQCLLTQVYQDGALDLAASLTVAQDVARRWAMQTLLPSGQ